MKIRMAQGTRQKMTCSKIRKSTNLTIVQNHIFSAITVIQSKGHLQYSGLSPFSAHRATELKMIFG